MVTRQPSFSSPTRLATGHPDLVEEELGELGGAGDGGERADLDAGRSMGRISQVMPRWRLSSAPVRTSSSQ